MPTSDNFDFGALTGLFGPTADDRRNALNMGLLSAGAALLSNQSPRLGPGLAAALQYGPAAYQGALEQAQAQRLQQYKLAQEAQRMRADQEAAQRRQQLLATLSPEEQRAVGLGVDYGKIWERNNPKGEAFTLSPGATRYGPDGRVVAQAPAEQKPTDLERMLDAAGVTDPAQRARFLLQGISKATTHAPSAQTNVTLRQEGEESKAVGKFFGESFGDIQKSGFEAPGKLARYERMEQLLNGVQTGKLTPLGTQVASYLSSVGVEVDPKLGNKQAAEALANSLALEARNPSGGAGMPGAMSDADREYLRRMQPGLDKTPEGNRQLIETAKRLAQRSADVAKLAREYRRKHGTFDEGFYDALAQWSAARPLFPAVRGAGAAPGGAVKFLGFED